MSTINMPHQIECHYQAGSFSDFCLKLYALKRLFLLRAIQNFNSSSVWRVLATTTRNSLFELNGKWRDPGAHDFSKTCRHDGYRSSKVEHK